MDEINFACKKNVSFSYFFTRVYMLAWIIEKWLYYQQNCYLCTIQPLSVLNPFMNFFILHENGAVPLLIELHFI